MAGCSTLSRAEVDDSMYRVVVNKKGYTVDKLMTVEELTKIGTLCDMVGSGFVISRVCRLGIGIRFRRVNALSYFRLNTKNLKWAKVCCGKSLVDLCFTVRRVKIGEKQALVFGCVCVNGWRRLTE